MGMAVALGLWPAQTYILLVQPSSCSSGRPTLCTPTSPSSANPRTGLDGEKMEGRKRPPAPRSGDGRIVESVGRYPHICCITEGGETFRSRIGGGAPFAPASTGAAPGLST